MNTNGTGSILGQCDGTKFNCVSMLAIIIIIIINSMYTVNDEKMSRFTTARKTSLEINSCPIVTVCDCPILFAKYGTAGLVLVVLQRTSGTCAARALWAHLFFLSQIIYLWCCSCRSRRQCQSSLIRFWRLKLGLANLDFDINLWHWNMPNAVTTYRWSEYGSHQDRYRSEKLYSICHTSCCYGNGNDDPGNKDLIGWLRKNDRDAQYTCGICCPP